MVLGVTGGIAAYKAAEVVRSLVKAGAEVHVIMTTAGQRFITPLTLQTLSGQPVITGQWDLSRGADVEHISDAGQSRPPEITRCAHHRPGGR
ncbi:MAG: hypothetical protein DMF52_15585 [Acidobacteria bacterium]|nr:MAG: hypothetical protein DMF52_15585 [Acidobacteriota bacterium]